MKLEIDGVVYPIVIEKKKTTKNTYIRVKEDLTIYVTTNILTRNSSINKIIDENYKAICKMIEKQKIKNNKILVLIFQQLLLLLLYIFCLFPQ